MPKTIWIEKSERGFLEHAAKRPIELGDRRLAAADLVLLLPARQVLVRKLTLPKVAMGRLREVLDLEVGADTPFEEGDVVWDYRLVNKTKGAASFDVELAFAERARVLRIAERAQIELGVRLAGIDRMDQEGLVGSCFNLLPESERKPRLPVVSNLNRVVLAACFASILIATTAATLSQARQLTAAESAAQQLRARAGDVLETRAAFREVRAALDAVMDAKDQWPAHVVIVDELSQILPDTTSLNELRIDAGRVDLIGQSAGAVDLIPLLERSSIFQNPRFASPVTSDDRSDKEKFQIALDLVGGGR